MDDDGCVDGELGDALVVVSEWRRERNVVFSSCSLRMSDDSVSARVIVGWGMHWKMVAKKLCNEMSSVSCHCLEKHTANTGCSSGFLQKGKTGIMESNVSNTINVYMRAAQTYRTTPSTRSAHATLARVS